MSYQIDYYMIQSGLSAMLDPAIEGPAAIGDLGLPGLISPQIRIRSISKGLSVFSKYLESFDEA
ncbi:MAG: hypothetical protein HWN66_18205 [Candidatus Helarchaeota archaeon]|nr:hypothetical protein [Candidatus Helarchaeota archaeon]